ncbi:hypothetical protein KA107_03035 [Candidatus Pacearchaeota archaeon]|nr:hypothetical protein [Candidatus Pacearchaeota archaeon]
MPIAGKTERGVRVLESPESNDLCAHLGVDKVPAADTGNDNLDSAFGTLAHLDKNPIYAEKVPGVRIRRPFLHKLKKLKPWQQYLLLGPFAYLGFSGVAFSEFKVMASEGYSQEKVVMELREAPFIYQPVLFATWPARELAYKIYFPEN